MSKKNRKDRSGEIGLTTGSLGAAGAGGTLYSLAGGSAAAPAITHALAVIGGTVGGGMAAGLGVVVGAPVVLGVGAYGASKVYRKFKKRK